MNITIIGASAGIGLEAVKRGLSRSHSITTLSRSEIGIQEKNKLNRVLGSATHKADLLKSIQNADAILITLGTSKDMKVTTLFSDFAKSLIATYNMYCHGYGFLDNVALGYGITFANDFFEFDEWRNLPQKEKDKRIDAIFAGVKVEAEKVRSWLEDKKIILTGEVNDLGHYGYLDNRTPDEKKPKDYSVIKIE